MFPIDAPRRAVDDVSLRWPLKGRRWRFGVAYLVVFAVGICILWVMLR